MTSKFNDEATAVVSTKSKWTDELRALVSIPEDKKRAFITSLFHYIAKPNLAECSRASKIEAARIISILGLDPGMGLIHVIPYGQVATVVPDYKGKIEIVHRTGVAKLVGYGVVYEKDKFKLWTDELGTHLRHLPNIKEADRGAIYCAYAIWKLSSGETLPVAITRIELERAKAASKAKDRPDSIWKKDLESAWLKTVFHQSYKYLPKTRQMLIAQDIEDKAEMAAEQKSSQYMDKEIADAEWEEALGETRKDMPSEGFRKIGDPKPEEKAKAAVIDKHPIEQKAAEQKAEQKAEAEKASDNVENWAFEEKDKSNIGDPLVIDSKQANAVRRHARDCGVSVAETNIIIFEIAGTRKLIEVENKFYQPIIDRLTNIAEEAATDGEEGEQEEATPVAETPPPAPAPSPVITPALPTPPPPPPPKTEEVDKETGEITDADGEAPALFPEDLDVIFEASEKHEVSPDKLSSIIKAVSGSTKMDELKKKHIPLIMKKIKGE